MANLILCVKKWYATLYCILNYFCFDSGWPATSSLRSEPFGSELRAELLRVEDSRVEAAHTDSSSTCGIPIERERNPPGREAFVFRI
ncbi:MAG: hypothetical protein PVI06_16140 [Desulfobacterales bacterium]|jgi:hypothetical protein